MFSFLGCWNLSFCELVPLLKILKPLRLQRTSKHVIVRIPPPPFMEWCLTFSNLAKRVEMIFFSRQGGVRLRVVDCLERGDSMPWHEIFIKKAKIFTKLCRFFKFSKLFFWNITLVLHFHRQSTNISKIHKGKLLKNIHYKLHFHISSFLNNLHVLH